MPPDMIHLLSYAMPPLVGAFTGYVTNDIAIRMPFRPLKPWRILGVRIPLTPGVLPTKRHEFAARIGKMVGSHLLTSEDVGRALEKETFRRELEGAVTDKLDCLLDQELGTVESLFPADSHMKVSHNFGVSFWGERHAYSKQFLENQGKILCSAKKNCC